MYVMYKNRVFKSIDGKKAPRKTFADRIMDTRGAISEISEIVEMTEKIERKIVEISKWHGFGGLRSKSLELELIAETGINQEISLALLDSEQKAEELKFALRTLRRHCEELKKAEDRE